MSLPNYNALRQTVPAEPRSYDQRNFLGGDDDTSARLSDKSKSPRHSQVSSDSDSDNESTPPESMKKSDRSRAQTYMSQSNYHWN